MTEPLRTYSSQVVQVGPLWPGVAAIKNLTIFGASYCDVKYDFKTSPRPTIQEPLGVPFPGTTYAEPGKANWVGHLVSKLKEETSLLVYDFAHGGDTTEGVERQIKREYLPGFFTDSANTFLQRILPAVLQLGVVPQWAASDTLFIVWVGINDCGYSGLDGIATIVTKLFGLIELLYQKGSRNLMLIDIPPMQRSPAMKDPQPGKYSFEEWNDILRVRASQFAGRHKDATVIIYSSWETFSRVLDNPNQYGFDEGDEKKRGGSIWVDHIHPTSKMHDELAKDITTLLRAVPSSRAL